MSPSLFCFSQVRFRDGRWILPEEDVRELAAQQLRPRKLRNKKVSKARVRVRVRARFSVRVRVRFRVRFRVKVDSELT